MKNLVVLLVFFIITFGVNAQNSSKKRVLVIPASQFEFATEFDLQTIAKLNETTASKVFLTYEKALLNSFETYQDDKFDLVPVDAAGLKPYKQLIKYEYGKFNKKHYNGVNLKGFSNADFTKLLAQYNADFVVFITWYDIQKEGFTRKGKHIKRSSYAGHYLDFAIYNSSKQQVAGVAKVKAEGPSEPNDLEVSFKFLRIKELQLGYKNFIGKVVKQINKPIKE
ncbi:MAG: hypothetical protein ACPGSL_09025 [Vicingaceae bacterium]